MEPGVFYHIYNCANGSENHFQEEKNYEFFLKKWQYYISPIAETYAYCLMPNHFHALIKVREEAKLKHLESFGKFQTFQKLVSKRFSNFFSSYAQS